MSDIKPYQIEKLLMELADLKEAQLGNKDILKHYKIESENLTRFKQMQKDLKGQIEDEKQAIEAEYLADDDYKDAKHDELLKKNEIKEKAAELRALMAKASPREDLSVFDYNIKGEMIKLQVERSVKVFINGKEER